jgi:alkylation response protein AidB-like acyl-CoA dehydrogenase
LDFRFTPEEEAFREEVRDFIKKELPQDYEPDMAHLMERSTAEEVEFRHGWCKKLAQKGWLGLSWPKEYGGQGRSFIEQMILKEEMNYNRVLAGDQFGIDYLGPALMVHGTEEQKKRHLGAITRAEIFWCEGYSEPNAGSDLASLQTRAVEKDDHFLVNGQKIWTSNAHTADWCNFLARTDPEAPKHKGLSYFLVDMKTPGITVRPLINMAGGHSFNEVFFEDVRVPKENLVGEKNRGWYVATSVLNFERSAIEESASLRRALDELIEYVKETKVDGEPLSKDPLIRHKLAQIAVEIEIARVLSYRVAWILNRGLVPESEASAAKLFGTELVARTANTAMQIMGLHAQLAPGAKWARLRGQIGGWYLTCPAMVIAGGSSEVQRNIIAIRALGMPRS